MTLNFDWFHVPRWRRHVHASRAVSLVLGIIVVSLLFSALRIVDVAVFGSRAESRAGPAASAAAPDRIIATDPPGAGPVDATTVDLPDAAAEAVSL